MEFRIHQDQENPALGVRKDADVFSVSNQRRALSDLSRFTCNQNQNIKLPGVTNGPCKVQDENRVVRQIKNEKNIVPPVAQFRAFNVYEDNPSEVEVKKREHAFKPFVAKEIKKDTIFKTTQVRVEKQSDQLKEAPPVRIPLQEKEIEKEKETKNESFAVESPMSVDTNVSLSVSKNESQIVEDEENEVTKAKTDREMFFHVVQYRQDIYEYMREVEVKNRPNPRYMRRQPDITHLMRSILVDWLVEVCDEYGQQSETLHLAVSYVDRFLSYMCVVRTKLQLVGTAATYLAAKYEEVYPPEVSEFVYITDDTYTKRDVLRMEHLMLKILSFDLSTPTSLAFLSHYCISNSLPNKTFNLAAYIAELSLLEADPYLQYKPSVIAAGALATARHCLLCKRCERNERSERIERSERSAQWEKTRLDLTENDSLTEEFELHPSCVAAAWPAALEQSSGYSARELRPVLRDLARSHSHAALISHRAIPDKYKTNKFDGVSLIEARPMFPVPPYTPPTPANAANTANTANTTNTANTNANANSTTNTNSVANSTRPSTDSRSA